MSSRAPIDFPIVSTAGGGGGGTLSIASGGTGATTAEAAAVALVNGNPINPSTIGATTPGPITGAIGALTSLTVGATGTRGDITAPSTATLGMRLSAYNGIDFWNTQYGYSMGSISGGTWSSGVFQVTNAAEIRSAGVVAASTKLIGFSSTTNTQLAPDTAAERVSAGVWGFNTGTAGSWGDVCARVLEAKTALRTASFTVATVPNASTYARGIIYVSDETGGATIAFSDGTNWRRVADRAIVS